MNSVETAIGRWSSACAKILNPCHCFREMESAISLLSEVTCTGLILKLRYNDHLTMALTKFITHSALAVLEFKMWTTAMLSQVN